MKLERKKLPVELEGQTYELSYLTIGEIEEMETKVAEGTFTMKLIKELLIKNGLPEAAFSALDSRMLHELFGELGLGSAKKK